MGKFCTIRMFALGTLQIGPYTKNYRPEALVRFFINIDFYELVADFSQRDGLSSGTTVQVRNDPRPQIIPSYDGFRFRTGFQNSRTVNGYYAAGVQWAMLSDRDIFSRQ